MSAPDTRPAPNLVVHVWWLLLLVALVLLAVATSRRIDRVEALTNTAPWSVDAPARDTASPTGFARGQRQLIVPGHHHPSFAWIMEAQQAVAQGQWRLRHIDYDARPGGRDILRTSPYRWWLIATGWLYAQTHGEPTGYGIERGALYADPLLLAWLLVVGAGYTARYLGAVPAVGFVAGGIALFPLAANFQPGAPDSHSLSWLFALGSLLPLLADPVRVGSRRRIHFALAGVCGGLGFWTDASTQAPVLLLVTLGALVGEWLRPRAAEPRPWRTWAAAGALTTLVASLGEFAPDHLSWSLDAVHPLHALVWWGMGELLVATGLWGRTGRAGFSPRAWVLFVLGALAVAVWPVAGHLSASGALLPADFHALELANHPAGGVAAGLRSWFRHAGSEGPKWALVLPVLLLPGFLAWLILGPRDGEARARGAFALVAATGAVVLGCLQLRWWNLFDVFLLALLPLLLTGYARSRWGAVGALLLILPGFFTGFPPAVTGGSVPDVTPLEAQALIARDYAHALVKRAGPEPVVLFSTPVFSSAAAFYGGFPVTASGDDGNKTGYLTAVRICSANTAQEGMILLNSRGITHVALPLWDPTLDQLVRIGSLIPPDQPLPPGAFVVAMRDWSIPLWMRPMDYLIPNESHFAGYELRALALTAEQPVELGLSRLADFFVERGQLPEAGAMRQILADYPRSVAALGVTANIDFALRDGVRLKETLTTLIPALSRRAARDLPADRRISLASLFLQIKRPDLARDQLTACLGELDARTVRTLTPATLVNLVTGTRSLGLAFPDRALERVALELIPPGVRDQLGPR